MLGMQRHAQQLISQAQLYTWCMPSQSVPTAQGEWQCRMIATHGVQVKWQPWPLLVVEGPDGGCEVL
jgi:hypothetical protein